MVCIQSVAFIAVITVYMVCIVVGVNCKDGFYRAACNVDAVL